jgi:PDZ domain
MAELRNIPLRERAAEYAHDELTADETRQFEDVLRADGTDDLRQEIALWRNLRTGLTTNVEVPASTTSPIDLAATVLRRHALERHAAPARTLRLPRWIAPAMAAAACLMLGVGLAGGAWLSRADTPQPDSSIAVAPDQPRYQTIEPVAYGEDGSAVNPPPATVSWHTYLPLSGIDEADATRPLPMQAQERSWIGLWTKDARLVLSGSQARAAHLVVRVVGGSPAYAAGLRPGDMILSIDGCGVDSAHCLGMHLAKTKPGDQLKLDIWSAADAAYRTVTVTLETVYE